MNKAILIGRLTRDPEVRYTHGEQPMCIARYTLAVDRKYRRNNEEQSADFISCISFSKNGEFAEKYFRKGMKVSVIGRIQTGSYTDKDGRKVYTTDVIIEEQEFAESKKTEQEASGSAFHGYGDVQPDADGFMNIPDGIDEELPFN